MTRARSLFAALAFVAAVAHAQEAPAPAPAPVPAPATPPPVATPAATPAAALRPEIAEDFVKAVFFGRKFFELKDYPSAYDQFVKADALQADHPTVLYDMALVLAKAGRYSDAQVKVDRYLQLYPNGAERPLVSKLQLELEFQRELEKKRQADRDYLELFNRGKFLYDKNDLGAALELFRNAQQQRPTDAAAIFNEALVLEKQGELARAAERFRQVQQLETDADAKSATEQHLFHLESELKDMKTKIVCPFCGLRLAAGAAWCPRCWHGPYFSRSPLWNSRPCADGATATRATYFSDDRFARNDSLPCMWNGTMAEALRYAPAKQRAIQDARRAEGWTYSGEVIQGWSDKQGRQLTYVQGAETLERIVVGATGDVLEFDGHKAADGTWLLDREDVVIDGQKYTSRYTYDGANRIAQQQVEYQNAAACNHLITEVADYVYANDVLTGVTIRGGYEGWAAEGAPKVDWSANVAYTYDANGRVAKEELAVTSLTKTYMQRPVGAYRDEVAKIYPAMRVRKPLDNILRTGDLCGLSGSLLLGNQLDLRPFYAMSPNLAVQLPYGVTKAVVTFTYPDAYRVK